MSQQKRSVSSKLAVGKICQAYKNYDREASAQVGRVMNPAMVADDDIVFNAVEVIREIEEEMQKASAKLEFEKAAHLRDQIVACASSRTNSKAPCNSGEVLLLTS